MNELVKGFLERDWGQVLLASAFGVIMLAFIGAPRAVSEIVGYAIQATIDDGAGIILALVAIPIGLLARNLRDAGILLAVGIIGLVLSAPNLSGDPEELGQTLIGLALFLAFIAAATRCAKHVYQSAKQTESFESADAESESAAIDNKPARKLGIATAAVFAALFVGNFIATGGLSRLSLGPGYYAAEEAAEAGAEAAEAGAEAAAEGAEAASANPILGPPFLSEVASAPATDYPEIGSLGYGDNIPQYRTSFDCSKASGFVESTICGNEFLAGQDVELSASFKKRIAGLTGQERDSFLALERAKLAERARCTTDYCIRAWYTKTLSQARTAETSKEISKLLEIRPKELVGKEIDAEADE